MASTLKIGIIQREITPLDPVGNLFGTIELMSTCLTQEVELFVLTELFTTGLLDGTNPATLEQAEERDGPTVTTLREFCFENGVYVLAGTIPLQSSKGITNTSLLIDPSGEIVLEYSKAHLFKSMGEDMVFHQGNSLSAVEIKGIGVGVLICYDLRFPGLARRLAKAGCELILVPALWPETRITHWEILLRARAIENQVWIVGANGIGNMHEMFFPGHSAIIGPAGDAMNIPEMRESAIVRTADITQLRNLRSKVCYIDDEIEISDVVWRTKVNE